MNDPRTYGSPTGVERPSRSALDTASDGDDALDGAAGTPHGPLLQLAERAVAERDALRAELASLRDALARDDGASRRAGASRELSTLREALELREREVRRLKDANVAREQLLSASRARLDEALHERAAAMGRLEVRDRQAVEAEAQRDASVAEARSLRRKLDAIELEHARAVTSERALAASFEDARLRLAEGDRDREALRAELADTREALAGSERARDELDARTLDGHARLTERIEEETARVTALERTLAEVRAELSMVKDELSAERAAREASDARCADGLAEREGLVRGGRFRQAELLAELSLERAARLCEASRQGQALDHLREGHAFALDALRARLAREHAARVAVEAELAEFARDRDGAAEVVARWIGALDARVDGLESSRRELEALYEACDQTRERLAQSAVDQARRASEARRAADEATEALAARTREMAELAGLLTRATVEQHATAAALRGGRGKPSRADVDEALMAVGARIPASVHEQLWAAREEIVRAVIGAQGVSAPT
jgi:hypothetical protein